MKITAFADPREAILTLAARRGTSLAALSRMLDRDPRYVGRFVREGRPARLPANDQQRLATFFGVDARDLGAADETPSARERMLERDRAKLAHIDLVASEDVLAE